MKPVCKAVIKISNVDAAVRYETPCGHVKERQGCKAVIKISNADATVRNETPCGRVKIVQETNKSENIEKIFNFCRKRVCFFRPI